MTDRQTLLFAFAADVLALLRATLQSVPWSPQRRDHVVFLSHGEWRHEELFDRDYSVYFKMNLYGDRLWSLPSAVAFAKWFYENPHIPGIRTTGAYEDPDFEQVKSFIIADLLQTVRDYLRNGGPLELVDRALLERSWHELGDLSQQSNTRADFLITGIAISGPISLGPFGTLEPLPPEQKTAQFKRHWWEAGPIHVADAAQCHVQLTVNTDQTISLSRAASIVMTGLRLFVQSRIYGWGPIVTTISDRIPSAYAYTLVHDFCAPLSAPGDMRLRDRGKPLKINPSDIEKLADALELLHLNAFDVFRTAFRRFNQGLRRSSVDDRLIDLAIVLESTVLAGAETELFWRAQVLGTELLRDEMAATAARDQIRALYAARSKIVHEGAEVGEGDWRKVPKDCRRVASSGSDFDSQMVNLAAAILRAVLLHSTGISSPKDLSAKLEEVVICGRT